MNNQLVLGHDLGGRSTTSFGNSNVAFLIRIGVNLLPYTCPFLSMTSEIHNYLSFYWMPN
jgi:hypothetical protein